MVSSRIRFQQLGGRDVESTLLSSALEKASINQGSLVVIEGDAGIGKTRLLDRLRESAEAMGFRFVRVSCYQYIRTPLSPMREAIEHLTGADMPLRRAKYEAFSAIVRALVSSSVVKPIALAIDDLQWADRATLELLDFAVQHTRDARIMLVCAYRDEHDAGRASTEAAVRRLAQHAALTIKLGPLDVAEVRELLEPALRASPTLRHVALDQIVARAGGNPLFIEEMLSDLADGDADESRVLPRSLCSNVMERLERVEPSVRRLIEAASIIGSDIRIDDLLAMNESPPGEQLEALDHALKTGFLHRRAASHVSFRHALIRDIVADGLSIADARRYHACIARRFGDRGEPAAAIAHHWARAGAEPQAAEWNERAGDDALNVFAYLDAAQFFRRAAELTSNRLLRPQLRERASDALTMNGSTRAALREKAIALEFYRELERSEDFLRVATGMIACSATDISYVASKRASRIAIAEAKRLAIPNMSCAAFVSAADHLRIAGHDKRTSVLLGRASPLVSQASLINISRYHDVAGKTAVGRLDNASARDHFTAAREVAERTGDLALVIRVVSNQAEFLQRVLEYDQALIIWRDLYRLAKERTFGWRIPFAALGLADMLILRGEFAEAAPLVDEALERGLECDQLRIQAGSIGTRLGLFLNRPDLIERCALDEWLESAFRIRDSAYLSPIAGAFVELALARGDDARAARIVSRYCKTAVGAMLSERMLPFVGHFGSDADIANAERLLGEMPPFIALLRASAAQRRGRASEAHVYSSTAELGFTRLALVEFAMIAHRISGKRARDVPSSDTVLTPREREICVEVAKGESNRAIADRLGISIKTVGHHLESIYARLGVEGRAKLIAYLNAMSQHSAA